MSTLINNKENKSYICNYLTTFSNINVISGITAFVYLSQVCAQSLLDLPFPIVTKMKS